MKLSVKILAPLVAGMLLAVSAYAQTGDGTITGKVTGRDGMPAANMQIFIDRINSINALQHQLVQRFEAKTGKQGGYTMSGLPPGSYQVTLVENGRPLMLLGDKPGNTISVADGRESTASFDMRKGPPPEATGGTPVAAPSAEAVANDRKAIEEQQKNKTSRDKAFKAGTDAYAAKDYEEAAKQFQTVATIDPKQDVAFANLGNSLNALKKYEEAAAAYQKAIELKPKEAAYFNNLGLALGGAKKMDDAKTAFDTAASMDAPKAGTYYFNEGAMYNNNQDYPKAIEAFKKCVIADPTNKGCLLQESISYFSSADTMPLAEPLLTKFLTLNPSPGDAETAKAFLEAIHTQAPTEFKSDAAIAADKKAAADAAAKAAKDAKTPPKATPSTGKKNN